MASYSGSIESSFICDVRLDDNDEILQLPIVKNRLKKLLTTAVKKIALLGAPIIPSSEDNLEQFLQSTGKFFGKDPTEWVQMGEPKIAVSEEGGKRVITSTGVFSGVELHMHMEPPHFDERLPAREDKPELNFHHRRVAITKDAQWQELIRDQPWSMNKRRQMLTAYLQAKMEADEGALAEEGCHGMWELSIHREHHADIRIDRLIALLSKLDSKNVKVATVAAAAVWGLATSSGCRRTLADVGVVPIVISNIKRSLKMAVVPDPKPIDPTAPAMLGLPPTQSLAKGESGRSRADGAAVPGMPEGTVTESQRAELQRHLLGGLAMLMVDRCCRRPYLSLEPGFDTLLMLCHDREGYREHDAKHRRETAAKVLTSLIQRDPDARQALITTGALKGVIELLNPQGDGKYMVQFCMASLLATMVLDDEAMELIRDRGEAPLFFEACLVLLTATLANLHEELDRQASGYYPDDITPSVYDLALGVRLAEAASQALWGSAYMCVGMVPVSIKSEHIQALGEMGLDCVATEQLPLSRVCHCIAATLASMASDSSTAQLLILCPEDGAINTLLTLAEVKMTDVFERAGHVKASACAGLAFLTCHPLGAVGDECMHGPYREHLLRMGTFGVLLRAALVSVGDPECDLVVQQAAAIGLMFLSTMAGSVAAPDLAMYSSLLVGSNNSEMIEFLMAGMWILLRNPDNRRCLGSSFNPDAGASKQSKGMMNKLNDALVLHEINDQAQEKAEAIRAAGGNSRRTSLAGSIQGSELPSPANLRKSNSILNRCASSANRVSGSGAAEQQGAGEGGEALAAALLPRLGGLGAVEEGDGGEDGAAAGGDDGGLRASLNGGEAAVGGYAGEGPTSPSRRGMAGGVGGASVVDRRDARAVPAGLSDDEGLVANGGGALGGQQGAGVRSELLASQQRPPTRERAERERERVRSEAAAASSAAGSGADGDLVKKFDKQLKENWGLETLVSVGESWLPAMMEQDAVGEATDVPVLKLFEFLVASICLFMIEEDTEVEPRGLDLFKLSAPPGVNTRTWWTVEARAPEPDAAVEEDQRRALAILIKIVGMKLPAAWKSLQLGVLTLWNVCARNAHMECLVASSGACTQLLDVINRPSWPASLRDLAGGYLSFMSERAANLRMFPQVTLPQEVAAMMQSPPHRGVVPAIAGFINLINSKQPLLEYRGCHAIARMCYAAPYGAENAREHIREAKMVTAVLGGVDALVALMKRVNKRYQDLVTGVKPEGAPRPERNSSQHSHGGNPPPHGAPSGQLPDHASDVAAFEKDMSGLEAQQDIYFVLFSALLNVSVLKTVQPLVAKKGLLVLLGTNTMLYCRLGGGSSFVVPAGEAEEKLLHLCSSIIQNLSLHPQNRTRMYKAELRGGVALDKLIEDATEVESDETLRSVAAMLPPITFVPPSRDTATRSPLHGTYRRGGSKTADSSPVFNSSGRLTDQPPRSSSPSRLTAPLSNRPNRSNRSNQRTAARLSPNGAVLNCSVDTATAGTQRPKVLFPNIVDKTLPQHDEHHAAHRLTAHGRMPSLTQRAGSLQPAASMQQSSSGLLPSPSTAGHAATGAGGEEGAPPQQEESSGHHPTGRGQHQGVRGNASVSRRSDAEGSAWGGADPSVETRNRFLSWMESAFLADEERERQAAVQGQQQGKKTYRRPMWDAQGDWLENEPETARSLHHILRRPITQMWSETPEAKARHGQHRWQPLVSEYHEAPLNTTLTRPAAKLLSTQPPTDELELMRAAKTLTSTGRLALDMTQPLEWDEANMPSPDDHHRPATSERHGGRMSLTVLKPTPEALSAVPDPGQEWRMGFGADGGFAIGAGGLPSPANTARRQGLSSPGQGPGSPGAVGPRTGSAGTAVEEKDTTVPLKLVLGPKRPRQVISFEDRIISTDDPTRPLLTMFEHVEGSVVGKGLYPSYQLPNGKQAYMYYNGGTMLDEVNVDAVLPPPRPSTVPAALQQTMPLADVLGLISKPPGSAPPFIPYKPVPYLVPLPQKHTLTVKHPNSHAAAAFGDLREDNLQLIIMVKKIIDTRMVTKMENIEAIKVEYREPWSLPMSIFKPRVKESDSHNFTDTEATEEKMFERDWQRACAKEKFTGMLSRENKANKSNVKDDKQMLLEVHDVLLAHYHSWYSAFLYYAGGGSGSDPYHMPLNAFTTFLDDCQIADSESQLIKRSDCDTIFIVCNFQPDKKSAEAQVNLENAMMRYEFLEALVRCAIAKYGKGQATDDVAEAVRLLLEHNVVANLPAGATVVSNTFRNDRLYCEEVDLLYKRHAVLLKALYSRYRLKPVGGGLRSKVMKLEGWLQMMSDASLVDSQFTLQDATLSFLWSRMLTIDEIKDYSRYTSFSFIDFLEGLGRVADMKSLPLESELEAAGYNNILEWSLDKERTEGNADKGQHGGAGGAAAAAAHGGAEDGSDPSASGDAAAAAGVPPTPSAGGGGPGGLHTIFRTRESAGFASPKSRPLYAKLELLLDLLFRRLFWDPAQADTPFNYDSLLKLIKKIDKELGP